MSDSAERTSEMTQDTDEETLEILIDDLSEQDIAKSMRIVEAVLFAAEEPLDVNSISPHLPSGYPISDLLAKLESDYEARGVQLKKLGANMRSVQQMIYRMRFKNILYLKESCRGLGWRHWRLLPIISQ